MSYFIKQPPYNISPANTRKCKNESNDNVLMQLYRNTHNRINDYLNYKAHK